MTFVVFSVVFNTVNKKKTNNEHEHTAILRTLTSVPAAGASRWGPPRDTRARARVDACARTLLLKIALQEQTKACSIFNQTCSEG